MDFWDVIYARNQGGGGNGGGGGKSKVIHIYEDFEELAKRPTTVMNSVVYYKIGNEVLTLEEFAHGLVGSRNNSKNTLAEDFLCYYVANNEDFLDDPIAGSDHTLFAAKGTEMGIPDATAIVTFDGDIVAAALGKEGAELINQFYGTEFSAGIWVSGVWLASGTDKAEFALAYNAKEPEEKWIGDGNTHIWIELPEERKSPMLGLSVNGTATVDWGDGTTPDVLTGTSSAASNVLWTPKHEYSRGGEYAITLTVDGKAGIGGAPNNMTGSYLLRNSAESDGCNIVYRNAIKRVELGTGIVNVGTAGLGYCYSLRGLKFPESTLSFGGNCMISCRRLERFNMSNNDSPLGGSMFSGCEGLKEVVLAESITDIPNSLFSGCAVLAYIKIPGKVSTLGASVFNNCYALKVCDFTDHSAVPTLSGTGAFNNVPEDCEIRVPAALAEEWKAATNWATYADYIVGV